MNKMTKEELISLVTRIRNVDFQNEDQYDNAIDVLENNVVDPYISDYIFHHKPRLTPEEIVEKALAYKPIILLPPDDIIKEGLK